MSRSPSVVQKQWSRRRRLMFHRVMMLVLIMVAMVVGALTSKRVFACDVPDAVLGTWVSDTTSDTALVRSLSWVNTPNGTVLTSLPDKALTLDPSVSAKSLCVLVGPAVNGGAAPRFNIEFVTDRDLVLHDEHGNSTMLLRVTPKASTVR